MTNCEYARHEGKKSEKDLSLCLKTFQNINKDDWLKMCDTDGSKISDILENEKILINSEETSELSLREKRLKYYTQDK